MRHSSMSALVLWGIVACAAFPLAAAQAFDSATRTVTVEPSGVDDTRALRTAFDVCQAVGPGCTVQLTEGTYRTQQLEVRGFRGTFAGAGMDATIVETLAPLPISPPDHDITVDDTDPEGGPVFMSFRNAHMTMRDLTLRNGAPVPTTGWRFNDFPITALAVMLVLEGDDLRVDVERVAIESVPGDGSVFNGVWIQSIAAYPGGPLADTVGTVTVRDSRIAGPEYGVVVQDVEGLTVVVRDNVITGIVAVDLWNVSRALVEIRGNDLAGSDKAVSVTTDPEGRMPEGPTTIVVRDNRLRTLGEDFAQAVGLNDRGRPATQFMVVERNVIEVDATATAAVGGAGEGLVVRDNVILGAARNGILVAGGAPTEPTPWIVAGNDFTGFTARDTDIRVTSGARGAVVVCAAPTSVSDLGQDSVVACD